MSTDLATISEITSAPTDAGAVSAVTPMGLLNKALEQGASVDQMEKLLALQERWEANQARKAFDNALSLAKAEIPLINKNRDVGYEHKNGQGSTSYRHEDLAEIARVVTPILADYGLSYRFRTTSESNQPVSVTCIVSHKDGHSEENTLTAGRDDSGNKNSIQAVGSTITYLQRYTLKAALGLAAAEDDDARSADLPETVSDDQIMQIRELIEAVGADESKLCEKYQIDALSSLPARGFDGVITSLKMFGQKRRAAK